MNLQPKYMLNIIGSGKKMQNNQSWVDEAVKKIHKKMDWVSDKNKDKIPYTTTASGTFDDKSDHSKTWEFTDGLDWWTNGFWGGLMWLLYQKTNEEKYAQYAQINEDKLRECIDNYYGIHHDIGFMYLLTAVANYRIMGNKEGRRTGLHTANLLAGRFNPAGNFIRAWNDLENEDKDRRGWAIIDCMMNLTHLYWAADESNDPRYCHIAMLHADTTLQHFIRPDGSVNHIVEFDVETGEFVRTHPGQGYQVGSSWSRGQSWALYGMALSYLHTRKEAYLEAAKRVAHYCIACIREDGIVPVDFRQPEQPQIEDSCAAAILASGLLELSNHVTEHEKSLYTTAAIKILKALYDKRTDWSDNCDAIVQNCSVSYHQTSGRHVTMVYADYFFVEAIYKLDGHDYKMW